MTGNLSNLTSTQRQLYLDELLAGFLAALVLVIFFSLGVACRASHEAQERELPAQMLCSITKEASSRHAAP